MQIHLCRVMFVQSSFLQQKLTWMWALQAVQHSQLTVWSCLKSRLLVQHKLSAPCNFHLIREWATHGIQLTISKYTSIAVIVFFPWNASMWNYFYWEDCVLAGKHQGGFEVEYHVLLAVSSRVSAAGVCLAVSETVKTDWCVFPFSPSDFEPFVSPQLS